MDENKEVNSTDPKREKVRVIPLSAIDDAPDHPFGVRDDDEMAELVESISTFGVINPVIVRKGEGERYELISGHRRKFACAKLGIDTLPVIVRDLSREEAIIFNVFRISVRSSRHDLLFWKGRADHPLQSGFEGAVCFGQSNRGHKGQEICRSSGSGQAEGGEVICRSECTSFFVRPRK